MRFVTPQSGDCFINGSEYFTKQREELYDTQKLIAEGPLYSFVTQKYSRTINDIQNSFTFTRNSRRLRFI